MRFAARVRAERNGSATIASRSRTARVARSRWRISATIATCEKDPSAVLDYSIGWSSWLPTGGDRGASRGPHRRGSRGRSVSSAERRIGHRNRVAIGWRAWRALHPQRARSATAGRIDDRSIEIKCRSGDGADQDRGGVERRNNQNAKGRPGWRPKSFRQAKAPDEQTKCDGRRLVSMPTASKPPRQGERASGATTKNSSSVGVRSVVSRFSTIGMSPPLRKPRR